MSFVHVVIALVFVLDGYWWRSADRRLRPLRRATLWRALLAAFVIGQALLLGTRLIPPAWSRSINEHLPRVLIAGQYLWHLAVLPVCVFAGLAVEGVQAVVEKLRSPRVKKQASLVSNPMVPSPPALLTRRQWLGAAAAAVPPLMLAGTTVASFNQLGGYRLRSFDLKIPNLPPKLNGVTIAHLSDFHAGQFMTRAMMAEIVDRVNGLRPDLVLVTGDLIDYALVDLPPALDALRRLRPKYGMKDGLAMCMGNHDCFQNRFTFKAESAAAGFPVLANSARTIEVAGYPVQLMAVDWCMTDTFTDDALCRTSQLRDPKAFPILLAHHPHAFDQADRLGFPLTLSGHTHGGQIMFNERIGVGALKFRYLTGLYRKPSGSQLVVSNGIGNWFPLRINAPAEVLKLTLRSG